MVKSKSIWSDQKPFWTDQNCFGPIEGQGIIEEEIRRNLTKSNQRAISKVSRLIKTSNIDYKKHLNIK